MQKFDLIYAYLVFTHLSPKSAGIAQLNKSGMMVMTARPEIYWRGHQSWPEGCNPESMMALLTAAGETQGPIIE